MSVGCAQRDAFNSWPVMLYLHTLSVLILCGLSIQLHSGLLHLIWPIKTFEHTLLMINVVALLDSGRPRQPSEYVVAFVQKWFWAWYWYSVIWRIIVCNGVCFKLSIYIRVLDSSWVTKYLCFFIRTNTSVPEAKFAPWNSLTYT